MTSRIPVLRTYFMLRAELDSPLAAELRGVTLELPAECSRSITQRNFQGKGSTHHPPFQAIEMGFELFGYDLADAERNVGLLFTSLERNLEVVRGLTARGVKSSLVANMNSMSAEQRPVFFLNQDQVGLLAQVYATIAIDGYLMF